MSLDLNTLKNKPEHTFTGRTVDAENRSDSKVGLNMTGGKTPLNKNYALSKSSASRTTNLHSRHVRNLHQQSTRSDRTMRTFMTDQTESKKTIYPFKRDCFDPKISQENIWEIKNKLAMVSNHE